jgi:quercetin dioxygenase-like cupin family protein
MTTSLLYVEAAASRLSPDAAARGKLTADDTQGAYLLWELYLPPGGAHAAAQAGQGQSAYYVLQGSCAFRGEGWELRATAGDVIHLPGAAASCEPSGGGDCLLLAYEVHEPAAGSPRRIAADQGRALAIVYDIGVFKLSGQETAGAFLLAEWHVPPQRGVPLHAQAGLETFYIIEGRFAFRSRREGGAADPFVAERGDVIHVPRRVPHSYKNIGERPGTLLVAMAPVGRTMQYFEEIGLPVQDSSAFPSDPPDLAHLLACVQKYRVDVFASSPDEV